MQEKTIYFRWSFRNFFPFLSRKGRALWAFALVERVAAGALKVKPTPPWPFLLRNCHKIHQTSPKTSDKKKKIHPCPPA